MGITHSINYTNDANTTRKKSFSHQKIWSQFVTEIATDLHQLQISHRISYRMTY